MNLLFFTQGQALDVYYQVYLRIKRRIDIGNIGFYVTHKEHYENFILDKPNFEVDFSVLKEWEIYDDADSHKIDYESLNRFESEAGDPNLWTPIVTDRRLNYGEKVTYFQDYKPFFSREKILKIIDVSRVRITNLFDLVKPDSVFTLYTNTFGDCLGHMVAKSRGIKSYDLRLARLKNYVMLVDGVNEPPPHISEKYDSKEFSEQDLEMAEEYISQVVNENAMYEGVVPSKSIIDKSDISSSFKTHKGKYFSFFHDSITKNYSKDPQNPNSMKKYLHQNFLNPRNSANIEKKLKDNFVDLEFVKNQSCALYPLHTEPELVLSQFARPYLNQIEVIRNISMSLPLTKVLLVKEHPLMVGRRTLGYYEKLLEIPNVKLVEFNLSSENVLPHVDIVIVIRGAIGLEAAIKKIPVISLGKSMFQILPKNMFRYCNSLYSLPGDVKDMLNNYKYDGESLKRYLSSVISGSVPVNLITDLLGKKNRFRTDTKIYNFSEHPHFDLLSDYIVERISSRKLLKDQREEG